MGVMRGNGDSVLDLDLLASPWSFWFVTANLKRSFTRKEKPKKRKRKKKRKKLKQNKQSYSLDRKNDRTGGQKSSLLAQVGTFLRFLALFKHFSTGSNQMLHVLEHSKIVYFSKNMPNALLDCKNDCDDGQKSSLKELLATTRMADFSTVFILKPKFFCENHTRQKLFYISSYVTFLVKIILIVIETRPKHGLCSCSNKSAAAYSYQFKNICRTINSSQKNREIITGKTWQRPKITSNPALDKVEIRCKMKGLTS